MPVLFCFLLFFFNDTATTEIYTLSLHDALPISDELQSVHDGLALKVIVGDHERLAGPLRNFADAHDPGDRKSTRLNSSHDQISYAVFCLKKKNTPMQLPPRDPRDPHPHRRHVPT